MLFCVFVSAVRYFSIGGGGPENHILGVGIIWDPWPYIITYILWFLTSLSAEPILAIISLTGRRITLTKTGVGARDAFASKLFNIVHPFSFSGTRMMKLESIHKVLDAALRNSQNARSDNVKSKNAHQS